MVPCGRGTGGREYRNGGGRGEFGGPLRPPRLIPSPRDPAGSELLRRESGQPGGRHRTLVDRGFAITALVRRAPPRSRWMGRGPLRRARRPPTRLTRGARPVCFAGG